MRPNDWAGVEGVSVTYVDDHPVLDVTLHLADAGEPLALRLPAAEGAKPARMVADLPRAHGLEAEPAPLRPGEDGGPGGR